MINREGTKKILKFGSILLIIIILVIYAVFESYNYIIGPRIVIYEPINGSTIATSSIIISGTAYRIKDIFLNGRPITIDKEGNFNEILLLFPGYNTSLLYANDKFKRTIEHKIELVYPE